MDFILFWMRHFQRPAYDAEHNPWRSKLRQHYRQLRLKKQARRKARKHVPSLKPLAAGT